MTKLTPQQKATITMRKRYGEDFFKTRAKRAGKANPHPHFKDPKNASKAGKKGVVNRWRLNDLDE